MARTIREIASGIYFGEAPRWREGKLWFSDFYAHAVMSISLSGDLRTEFTIDDQPSGLGWMPDGSMLIVGMTKREVLRRTSNGELSVHARLGDIATFHCNDMVVDQNGRAYVGNFGLNLDEEAASRPIEEVIADHVTAKLACVFPGGEVQVAADEMHFPNGSVITPDGKTLIVAETLGFCLTAFDIADDGSLSHRRVWASTGMRIPDGICLDADGAVWFANPMANECVRIAEGGEILEVINTGQLCFACMLGGDNGRSLFMLTADSADAHTAAAAPSGRVLVTEVDSPRSGFP
jgi:sugar lactone lactonase YvrE